MATAIPARLSRSEARHFGLLVGGAFVVLGGVLWWRGKHAAWVPAAVGAILVVAGIVAPTLLGPVHRVWMGGAERLSKITTPIVLGVVYFVAITPLGVVRRLLGKNSLDRSLTDDTYWVSRDPKDGAPGRMERQF